MRLIDLVFLFLNTLHTAIYANAKFNAAIFKELDTNIQEHSGAINFLQCHLQHPSQHSRMDCSILCSAEELCIGFDFKSPNCYLCYFDVNTQRYAVKGEFYAQQLTPTNGYMFPMDVVSGATLVGDKITGTATSPLVLHPGITNQTGHSLSFDGTTAVEYPNLHDTCFSNLERCTYGITIAAWLKVGTLASTAGWFYVSAGGQTSAAHGWAWLQKAGQFQFAARTTSTVWPHTKLTLPFDTWTHVTTSWHSQEGVKVYVNFKLVKTTSPTPLASPNNKYNLTIAAAYNIGQNVLFKFGNFTIDELKILQKSVTTNMIKELQLATIS